MSPCFECGGATVWDDDAASAICTACGTLVDASQSVLTNIEDYTANPAGDTFNPRAHNTRDTLMSIRNPNWSLAGQGKDAKDKQNASAMNEFISSLTTALQVPGLYPRASTLFTQAMATGNFRWGRKAKLVAGASLSIALRESKRPDFRHDIAFMCDEKVSHLTRVLSTLITHFNFSLPLSDASYYLPTLQEQLSAELRGESKQSTDGPTLPSSVITSLKPLNMSFVLSTASALSDLLAYSHASGPSVSIQASAAAILILSLEGQARTSLLGLGELAGYLAQKLKVGKGLVMKRYKTFQDALAEMMKEISWLDQWQKKDNGRSKVAKRTLIARGLSDIIAWGRETRKAKLSVPTLLVEEETDEDSPSSNTEPLPRASPQPSASERPQKKQKLCRTMSEASKFLLDPLSSSLPTSSMKPDQPSTSRSQQAIIPMTSYLLSAPTSALNSGKKPTRLQMLAVAKHGDAIQDDELFDDGELDAYMRSENEVQTMSVIWEQNYPASEERPYKEPKKRKRRLSEPAGPSRKVNRDALAQFMRDFEDGEDVDTAITSLAVNYNQDDDEGEGEDKVANDSDEERDGGDSYAFENIHTTMARERERLAVVSYDDDGAGYTVGGEPQDYW